MGINEAADARSTLREAIDDWRSLQREMCPSVFRFHKPRQHPEKEGLLLPSSFDKSNREHLDIAELANLEFEVRLGQAYDAIDSLRTAVYVFNAAKGKKIQDIRGTAACTRANVILRNLQNDKYGCAKVYHLAYTALLSLGLPDSSELRPLPNNELWGRDMMTVHQPGASTNPEPWWWVVGKPPNESDEAWYIEREFQALGLLL